MFGFVSSCSSAAPTDVRVAELYGGEVTVCFTPEFAPYIEDGRTGLSALDDVEPRTRASIDAFLRARKRKLEPTRDNGVADRLATGADTRWSRLCDVKLPDGAVGYAIRGLAYDLSKAEIDALLDYPEHTLRKTHIIKDQLYFDAEDRLRHVELHARPLQGERP